MFEREIWEKDTVREQGLVSSDMMYDAAVVLAVGIAVAHAAPIIMGAAVLGTGAVVYGVVAGTIVYGTYKGATALADLGKAYNQRSRAAPPLLIESVKRSPAEQMIDRRLESLEETGQGHLVDLYLACLIEQAATRAPS